MSLGITNRDTSFFTIESESIAGEDLAKNLISLNITERSGGMPTGSLAFYDPQDRFSYIFRSGREIAISWGYKNLEATPDSLLTKKLNFDEISGVLQRRGLKGFVSSPKGSGDNRGVKTFTCQFTSYGFRGLDESKIYLPDLGTRADIISAAFDEIGVLPNNRLINFSKGKERIPVDGIRKDETTFLFLNKLAREWRAFFQMGFSPTGQPIAIFIDPNLIGNTQYQLLTLGATGKSNIIGYMGELNNVKSFTWTSNEAESGVGDNIQLDIVDGKIIFRKFVAQREKVITYRLNIEKIQSVFKESGDLTSQIKLTKELLSKKDFESVKHYFTEVESSTAPMGAGYRIRCEMAGNPLYAPPNQIKINNGFPEVLQNSNSLWFIQSVNHTIDRSGYNMSVEIVDVFTLSPIGLPVR